MSIAVPSSEIATVLADLDALAMLSAPGPGVSRVAYTTPDAQGRAWFARRASELGMEFEVDPYGTCLAWSAGCALQPAVLLGSHLDSVRQGGRYDGALGVVAAFAVAAAVLHDDPTVPIAVVSFACEESTRFGIGAVGSALLTGALGSEALDRLRDEDGATLREVLAAAGLPCGGSTRFAPDRIRCFLEVHIDQGSALADGDVVGIVSAIAGTIRTRITFTGEAAHSGAHVRDRRRDALLGAARLIVEAERMWSQEDPAGDRAAVTIGRIEASPNAANAVAGRAEVIVDLRAPDAGLLDDLHAGIVRRAGAIADVGGLAVELEVLGRIAPVAMDGRLVNALQTAARRGGIAHRILPSMAGHDAEVIAHHIPTAMLFVANPAAVSHNPDEAISEASLAGALAVLDLALPQLRAERVR